MCLCEIFWLNFLLLCGCHGDGGVVDDCFTGLEQTCVLSSLSFGALSCVILRDKIY